MVRGREEGGAEGREEGRRCLSHICPPKEKKCPLVYFVASASLIDRIHAGERERRGADNEGKESGGGEREGGGIAVSSECAGQ